MKNIINLTAWHWRMARRPYALCCLVFAAEQLIVLSVAAAGPDVYGAGIASLYEQTFQYLALMLALLAAGIVSGWALLQTSGRSRCGITLLTLPMPRWQILASQLLLSFILLLGVAALQVLLYIACYFPVTAISRAVTSRLILQPVPDYGLYRQLNYSIFIRVLLPVRAAGLALLLLSLAFAALSFSCIFVHHGVRRLLAAIPGGVGAVCLLWMLYIFQDNSRALPADFDPTMLYLPLLAVTLVCAAVNLFWALRSLRRAELA